MAEAFAALFEKARLGDGIARDALYRLAFFRLRGIASGLLRRERPGHTLQPTALVSELFLKLRRLDTRILSDDHFFRISARAMRQVLIDHSRHKRPAKMVPAELIPELLLPANQNAIDPESALAVKMVFEKLRAMDAKVAETVWLRSVEGVTIQELSSRAEAGSVAGSGRSRFWPAMDGQPVEALRLIELSSTASRQEVRDGAQGSRLRMRALTVDSKRVWRFRCSVRIQIAYFGGAVRDLGSYKAWRLGDRLDALRHLARIGSSQQRTFSSSAWKDGSENIAFRAARRLPVRISRMITASEKTSLAGE